MIVTCVQCDTRFRLDDEKVSLGGLNVRCSICKHAFFVRPPDVAEGSGASQSDCADPVQRIAEAAIDSALSDGPASVPHPTQDLPPAAGPGAVQTREERAEQDSGEAGVNGRLDEWGDENEWEFDREHGFTAEDQPSTHESDAATPSVDDPSSSETTHAAAGENEALGNPADWDFFGPEGVDLAVGPEAPATPIGKEAESRPVAQTGEVASDEATASDPAFRGVSGIRAEVDSGVEEGERASRMPTLLLRAGDGLGWLSVIALFAFGLHSGLKVAPTLPSTDSQMVAGVAAESIEARWIENILSGPLYVVSGSLRNPGEHATAPGALIALRLFDESGRPLDVPSATLGPELSELQIREGDPDELVARLEIAAAQRARLSLAPGESYRFHAIWREVPPSAASFRFESAPLSLHEGGAVEPGSFGEVPVERESVTSSAPGAVYVEDADGLRPADSRL